MREMFSGAARPPRRRPEQAMAEPRAADRRRARRLRARPGARGASGRIDPDRIGMVGFSAGAMLTMATTLAGKDAKPAFIGNIYGPLAPVTVPADAPPMFVALAADDPLFGNGGFGLIDSWRAAKRPVEFHLYEQGGHGFGMYPKETTSTGWFDAFVRWIGHARMDETRDLGVAATCTWRGPMFAAHRTLSFLLALLMIRTNAAKIPIAEFDNDETRDARIANIPSAFPSAANSRTWASECARNVHVLCSRLREFKRFRSYEHSESRRALRYSSNKYTNLS